MASRTLYRRHLGIAAAAAAFLLVLLVALPAHAAPRKVALEFACAKAHGGALRYAKAAGDCRSGERPVDIAADAPVYTCLRGRPAAKATIASQDRRGLVRRVGRDGGCGRDRELVLPGVGARSFCVNRATGALRNVQGGVPCHRRSEFKAIVAAKRPADLRVACGRAGRLLRFAESVTGCGAREHAVRFTPGAPQPTCVGAGRSLLRLPSGAGCSGGDRALTLPAERDVLLCVDRGDRHLRVASRCRADDIRVIVRGIGVPLPTPPAPVPSHHNAAPALAGIESSALAVDTGAGPVAVTSSLRVSDADGVLAGAAVAVASGYRSGHDTLTFTPASGIHGAFSAATGALVLTGPASPAAYQAVLRSVRFAADASTPAGTRTIGFRVTDGEAASATLARSVAVHHVNHSPQAADDSATAGEDAPVTIPVLANDADADADALTVTADTAGTTGSVTVNPNGSVTYDPAGGFESLQAGQTGHDAFAYTVSDGHGGTSTAAVAIGIAGANDAPALGGMDASPLGYDTGSGPLTLAGGLTVDDVDTPIASAQVRIASGLEMAHDTLAAGPTPGITSSYDALGGVLTLTGSAPASAYQAALRSVTFAAGAPTQAGTRTIAFSVDDGSALDHASNTATRTVAVSHVNHPPVADDDAATVGEDGAVDVPVLANDTDPDADALHVAGTSADTTIHYSAAGRFDSLPAGGHATDTVLYKATDGALDSGTATLTMTIDGADDAPLVSAPGSAAHFTEGDGPAPVAPDVTVADIDSGDELAGATVTLSAVDPSDALVATPLGSGPTPEVSPDGHTLTITGAGTPADYQALLRGVGFVNGSDDPAEAARTVTITVDDGDATSAPVTNQVLVTAVEDPTVADWPDTAPSVVQGDTLAFAGRLTISDPDTDTETVALGPVASGRLTDGTTTATTLGHTGTTAENNAWLAGVSYIADPDAEGTEALPVHPNVTGDEIARTVAIDVVRRNAAPVNDLPVAPSTDEDQPATIAAGVSDPDAGIAPLQVSLDVAHGTLTLPDTSGLSFSRGDGTGDAGLTFTGSPAALNAALQALVYSPAADYNGADTLTMVTDDLGHSGGGGARADTDTVGIAVAPVNDAPVNTVPAGTLTADADHPLHLTGALAVADVDAGTDPVSETLSADHGTLTLGSTAGLTFTTGDGDDDPALAFSGPLSAVNAALSDVTFTPAAGYSGLSTITLVSDDQGATGAGGALQDTDSFGVAPLNQPPVNALPATVAAIEDTPAGFPAAGVSDPDAGTAALQVALDATHGTLTLGGTGGLSFTRGDGTADAGMTFTGAQADLTAALSGMTFTPDAGYTGPATVTMVSDDLGHSGAGGPRSDTDSTAITVARANRAPVNHLPADQATDEDTPLTLSGAAAISVSDADAGDAPLSVALGEAHGTLTLTGTTGLDGVTGNGTGSVAFTGAADAVNAALDGLVLDPGADYDGAAPITITTNDQGATGAGGAKSDTDTLGVTVNPVDDAPVLAQADGTLAYTENDPATPIAPNLAVSDIDDTDLHTATVRIASGFAAGQDRLDFTNAAGITGSYDTSTGILTLTGDASVAAYRTALRSVGYRNLSDNPTTARTVAFTAGDGGATSNEVTRGIAITPVNDAPAVPAVSLSGTQRAIGNTALVTTGAPDPAGPQKTIALSLLAGASDPEGDALSVEPGSVATSDGGSVDLQSDGGFAYHPKAGTSCTDHSDSFPYTVDDANGASSTGTVTVAIADCVWYVDASAAGGGTGTSEHPLSSAAPLNDTDASAVADQPGDVLFLYPGSYSGGIKLEDDQQLLTKRNGLRLPDGGSGSVTLESATAATEQLDGGVVLAKRNSVQGLDLGSAGGFAIAGANVGTADLDNLTTGTIANATGGAVSITGGGTLNAHFSSVTSSGSSGSAIALDNTAGTFTADAGTLGGATGTDVSLTGDRSGDTLDFTYKGTISDTDGRLVNVSGQNGGTKSFTGAITDAPGAGSGGGIMLSANGGATIRFSGGLRLSTDATNAFTATGGGTVEVTGSSNRITTGHGVGLTVADTTIGAGGLSFATITSNGAPSGIALTNTGSSGGLSVGGGTISNSTGPGVDLDRVGGGASLADMSILNGGDDGVQGTSVAGFSLARTSVTNNGNAIGESGVDFDELTGTLTLDTDSVTGSANNNVRVEDTTGTLTATVTGGSYGTTQATFGADGIRFGSFGTATVRPTISGATFTNNRDDQIQLEARDNGTMRGTVASNTLSSNSASVLGGGITVNGGNASSTFAAITGNQITGAVGGAIAVDTAGTASDPQTAQIDATITGNTVGAAGLADSGSKQADGILLSANGLGDIDAVVDNNTVSQYANLSALRLIQNDGNGSLDVTARGNTFGPHGSTGRNGILAVVGGATGTETGSACLDLGHASDALKNLLTSASAGGTGSEDIRVRQRDQTTIRLPGYSGATNDNTAVAAFLAGRNDRGGSTPVAAATNDVALGGHGFAGGPTCTTPGAP